MESKGTLGSSEQTEKVLYELAADGACEFEGEESIQIGRGMLAYHSKFFAKAFFGSEPKNEIKIKGFNRASFKTFLDCLFGMKEYALLDALLIYPIAHQYEVKESLDKCAAVLKPADMSDNVSRVLNLATFYNCKELTDYVINFVKTKYGIVNFLENKEYCDLLEPSAICKLIEEVDLNSVVWTLVYQWGENYLKKRGKCDIKSFFLEHGILEKISLDHFESAKTVITFHVLTNNQLMSSNEIFSHLEKSTLEFDQSLPHRSDWVKVESGHSFSEIVTLKKMFYLSEKESKNNIRIFIGTNKVLVEPENSVPNALKIKARFIFRHISTLALNQPLPVWRSDLNIFYREMLVTSAKDFQLSAFCPSNELNMQPYNENYKMPIFRTNVTPKDGLEIHSFKITYSFNCPSRILKSSLDMNKGLIDRNDLYFTNDIAIFRGGVVDD